MEHDHGTISISTRTILEVYQDAWYSADNACPVSAVPVPTGHRQFERRPVDMFHVSVSILNTQEYQFDFSIFPTLINVYVPLHVSPWLANQSYQT
jgi:hypothetical protein